MAHLAHPNISSTSSHEEQLLSGSSGASKTVLDSRPSMPDDSRVQEMKANLLALCVLEEEIQIQIETKKNSFLAVSDRIALIASTEREIRQIQNLHSVPSPDEVRNTVSSLAAVESCFPSSGCLDIVTTTAELSSDREETLLAQWKQYHEQGGIVNESRLLQMKDALDKRMKKISLEVADLERRRLARVQSSKERVVDESQEIENLQGLLNDCEKETQAHRDTLQERSAQNDSMETQVQQAKARMKARVLERRIELERISACALREELIGELNSLLQSCASEDQLRTEIVALSFVYENRLAETQLTLGRHHTDHYKKFDCLIQSFHPQRPSSSLVADRINFASEIGIEVHAPPFLLRHVSTNFRPLETQYVAIEESPPQNNVGCLTRFASLWIREEPVENTRGTLSPRRATTSRKSSFSRFLSRRFTHRASTQQNSMSIPLGEVPFYAGDLQNGGRHGVGVGFHLDGKSPSYYGHFRDNSENGVGVQILLSGERVVGTWEEGNRTNKMRRVPQGEVATFSNSLRLTPFSWLRSVGDTATDRSIANGQYAYLSKSAAGRVIQTEREIFFEASGPSDVTALRKIIGSSLAFENENLPGVLSASTSIPFGVSLPPMSVAASVRDLLESQQLTDYVSQIRVLVGVCRALLGLHLGAVQSCGCVCPSLVWTTKSLEFPDWDVVLVTMAIRIEEQRYYPKRSDDEVESLTEASELADDIYAFGKLGFDLVAFRTEITIDDYRQAIRGNEEVEGLTIEERYRWLVELLLDCLEDEETRPRIEMVYARMLQGSGTESSRHQESESELMESTREESESDGTSSRSG